MKEDKNPPHKNKDPDAGFVKKAKKKVRDRILLGYMIQTLVIILVVLLGYAFTFFDKTYQFVIRQIFGKEIIGLGLIMSLAMALLIGTIAETKRGWKIISRVLEKIPLVRQLPTVVDQWKIFREFADKYGVILAPFYRVGSTLWPAVVTGAIEKEEGGHYISVVFFDPPFFRPQLLTEEEEIRVRLSFGEAFSYILTWGLSLRLLKRRLKKTTLREYVRLHPAII